MGYVMSFSLPTGETCNTMAPCWTSGKCYAHRMELRHPSVKKSWAKNLSLLRSDDNWGDTFVKDTIKAIHLKKPELFRWHVGGDIFAPWYLDNMCLIAKKCPDVSFWTFTKQFDILENYESAIPDNLNIILSVWPPCIPSVKLMKRFGCCYFQDKSGTFIVPNNAFECEGDCEMCTKCATLGPGQSVVIIEH